MTFNNKNKEENVFIFNREKKKYPKNIIYIIVIFITYILFITIIRKFSTKYVPTEERQNTSVQLKIKSTKNEPNNKKLFHNGIISSQISQSSVIFQGPGQGLQCIPNCILSLIYNMYKTCKYWRPTDLKNILYSGNILYNSIGKTTTLLVSELPQYIKLYNYIYNIKENNSIIGNIFEKKELFNCLTFNEVEDFLCTHKYCILIIGDSAISIQYIDKKYYTFDPHQRNTYGFPDSNGFSIALKFHTFNNLCSYICELSKKLNSHNYELIPISITKYTHIEYTEKNKLSNNQIEQPEINNMLREKNTETILKLYNTEKIESSKNEKTETDENKYILQKTNKRKYDSTSDIFLTSNHKRIKNCTQNKANIEKVLQLDNTTIETNNKNIETNNNRNISTETKNKRKLEDSCNLNLTSNCKYLKINNEDKTKITNNNTKKRKYNAENEINSEIVNKNKHLKINKTDNQLSNNKIKEKININSTNNNILKLKITNVMNLIHKKNNQKVLSNIIENNKLCKKYGYNLKIPVLQIRDITETYKIKNKHYNITNNEKKYKEKLSCNHKKQYGTNLEDSIQIFNKLIQDGPIYVCTVCQQNNFSDKVMLIEKMYKKNKTNTIFQLCRTNYKSIDNKEYICNTCKKYIYKNKIPVISVKNGCIFPPKPKELDLFNLEERFISPVMAFMLIHQLFPGGQLSLYGSICHLPIQIGKVIETLPRTLDQYETISVKLKRRLCYKNAVFSENIRPQKIISALHYLLNNSELYRNHNININEQWLENFTANQNENTNNLKEINTEIEINENDNNTSDEDNENEELPNAPSVNTLLTDNNIDSNNEILCIAPAEGEKPIFTDENAEYLCFPTIFCGQKRNNNEHYKLTKREIFKYEMRSTDKRVSTNIPNIFWKTKYKQINQINQQVSFALRRNQSKGKQITAKTLLNKEERQQIVKYNDGYKIFKNIRSSPPYFEQKRKDLMAMIRQLGIPTLFISLSAADTKWTELLRSIYIQLHKKNISHEQINNLQWTEKCKLISTDPGTCALYFNNRIRKFIKHILKSPYSPLGKLQNIFHRVEFQHRGSPHIHGLLWIKNAPHYEKNSDSEIINYIDSIITCSSDDKNKQYIDLQIHKHSKTCIRKINNQKRCRFGSPWPPLDKTQILYPLNKDEIVEKEKYLKIYKDINKFIQLKYKKKEIITFNQILKELNITYELYILALRTTINKKKVFLKRNLSEIFINNYMKQLINVWKANHDIQYVLDPYSCVVYICDYLMKNNKGMSKLLEAAANEAKQGNMDLKQSVRHIGNKFLNCAEMSEQECAYSLLELPITQSSIKIEFINTSEIHDRVFIAKLDICFKKNASRI